MNKDKINNLKEQYAESYLEGMSDNDIYYMAFGNLVEGLTDDEAIEWADECGLLKED